MKDIRIVSSKQLLKISSIAPIREFLPPSAVILGENFNLAQEIVFNGVTTTEFAILSPTRIIFPIPESEIGLPLQSIKVYSSPLKITGSAELNLTVGSPSTACSGIERLIQAWILIFLSTPGSDIWDLSGGGGGRALIGNATDRDHGGAASSLAMAVEKTKEELLRLQAKDPRIPPAERLLSCELSSINFDEGTTVLSGVISIRNMIGDDAEVVVK